MKSVHHGSLYNSRNMLNYLRSVGVIITKCVFFHLYADCNHCNPPGMKNVRGERRLRRNVRSHGSQELTQITTKFNDGHRIGFGIRQPTRVTLVNVCHQAARLAWARDYRDWSVKNWKRVAWIDESSFRLLNTNGKLIRWRKAHESMDHACPVGTLQGHDVSVRI
ncbi:transposable element Tcb2 transposase [Trichonephila clavipes]|uniref:Transposable element Tcb2 transposase n=1 Tax=Trichonephila clavipes TaxID=2585209 RepID=A0A8X6VW72_TRICX|nr:transposable element Tcb2 transposase [Trichonephila clavipes]